MIKHINSLTESDKHKFYESAKASFIRYYDMPWEEVEASMKRFVDCAFDDKLFVKLSPDDKTDASYCRKYFGNKKPSIYDFVIWQSVFASHSEYVEIPDEYLALL